MPKMPLHATRVRVLLVLAMTLIFPAECLAQSGVFDDPFDEEKRYEVKKVVRADKLILDNNKAVTLIGLRAPEPPERDRTVERDKYGFVVKKNVDPRIAIEIRALEFARELLEGRKVRLEFDYQKRDEDFNTIAYVFLPDGRMANIEILRTGFAHLKIRPPNLKYADQLREAYREARREQRGLQGQ